jgi:hypothetical protein
MEQGAAMICLDCKHVGMKASPKHTAVGFAPCLLRPEPGVFMSLMYKRECPTFELAPADARKARHEWAERSGKE